MGFPSDAVGTGNVGVCTGQDWIVIIWGQISLLEGSSSLASLRNSRCSYSDLLAVGTDLSPHQNVPPICTESCKTGEVGECSGKPSASLALCLIKNLLFSRVIEANRKEALGIGFLSSHPYLVGRRGCCLGEPFSLDTVLLPALSAIIASAGWRLKSKPTTEKAPCHPWSLWG